MTLRWTTSFVVFSYLWFCLYLLEVLVTNLCTYLFAWFCFQISCAFYFWFDWSFERYFLHCLFSGMVKYPVANGMESLSSAHLKVNENYHTLLHRLVSEGNSDGVRLVYFSSPLLVCSFYSSHFSSLQIFWFRHKNILLCTSYPVNPMSSM